MCKFINVSIYVVMVMIVFVSCNQRYDKIERTFYESGNIKEVTHFKNDLDNFPSLSVSFYEDGIVKDSSFYNVDGKLDGVCYSYDNEEKEIWRFTYRNGIKEGWRTIMFDDGLTSCAYMINDQLHGIQYMHNSSKELVGRQLWLCDTPVLRQEFIKQFPGDTLFEYSSSFFKWTNKNEIRNYITEDTVMFVRYSNLVYDFGLHAFDFLIYNNGKIDGNSPFNFHHIIQTVDTIQIGDPLKIYFKSYTPFKSGEDNLRIHVYIGGLKPDLSNDGEMVRIILPEGVTDDVFYHTKYKLGYNLLLGMVDYYLEKELIKREYIFEDFYVENAEK